MPGDIHGRSLCIPDQVEDKLDAGKAVVQIAAVEITVDHLFDIGPPEAVISGKPVVINLHEGFKVILHAAVITGSLRISVPINGGWDSHDPSPPRKAGRRLQNVRSICQAEYRAIIHHQLSDGRVFYGFGTHSVGSWSGYPLKNAIATLCFINETSTIMTMEEPLKKLICLLNVYRATMAAIK